MAQKHLIPHVPATSKSAILAVCDEIRRRAPVDVPLSGADFDKIDHIWRHFARLRDRDEDKGRAVVYTVTRPANYPNTRSFARNGCVFSMDKHISPPTHSARVTEAARRAIADQVVACARASRDDPFAKCPLSGDSLYLRSDIEIDHYPDSFAKLWTGFLEHHALLVEDIELFDVLGGGVALPEPFSSDWARWHRKHAKLRALTSQAHAHHTRTSEAQK